MIVPWAGFPTLLYVKDGRLTTRGKAVAEGLLREIYEALRFAEREGAGPSDHHAAPDPPA